MPAEMGAPWLAECVYTEWAEVADKGTCTLPPTQTGSQAWLE